MTPAVVFSGMPNTRHFLVKFWKCQKAVCVLPHEAKALLELFCLQPIIFGWRQNSCSSSFASWGKIKIHDFTLADQDWIGLMICKNFADQDWIGFNFIEWRLYSDWKISQSAHLCCVVGWIPWSVGLLVKLVFASGWNSVWFLCLCDDCCKRLSLADLKNENAWSDEA